MKTTKAWGKLRRTTWVLRVLNMFWDTKPAYWDGNGLVICKANMNKLTLINTKFWQHNAITLYIVSILAIDN